MSINIEKLNPINGPTEYPTATWFVYRDEDDVDVKLNKIIAFLLVIESPFRVIPENDAFRVQAWPEEALNYTDEVVDAFNKKQ